MSKMACPGQDTRFWRPGDIFEVECGECGHLVEFFKDDASRRCPKCGNKIINPKVSLGCAQWCQYAEKCLGFDPKRVEVMAERESSLADKLIEAVKRELGDDQRRITHALLVLERAQELLRREEANPRVVVAAALLHDIGIQEAERKHGSCAGRYQELEGPPMARRILRELDLDDETIDHVCRIVGSHHSARDIDTPEFRVLWDADWLVNIPEECSGMSAEELSEFVARTLRTRTARAWAAERLVAGGSGPDDSDGHADAGHAE